MSLLTIYQEPGRVIAASDARVQHNEFYGEFPKFQTFETNRGLPVLLGGVGNLGCIHKIFRSTPRMVRDIGMELPELSDFLPGAIKHLLARRPAHEVNAARDIKFPPVQVILSGYDASAGRMRSWLMVHTGQGDGVTHELASKDFIALGFIEPADDAQLRSFNDFLLEHGPSHDADWVCDQMADEISKISDGHPDAVGRPKFYAAFDKDGPINLRPELKAPWNVAQEFEHVCSR